jgi:hypothetical protein
MSLITTGPPTQAPAIPDLEAAGHADHRRHPKPSRISVLLEALAYAGAAFDPASALAAQRFASLRDEELRHGRW